MTRALYDAVLLLAFGGPESMQDVRPFLRNVCGGRLLPEARVRQVEERYRLVGGRSPLNELTARQARALADRLRSQGLLQTRVWVGMRHWPPFIREALARAASDGARRVLCLVMAPFQSEASLGVYRTAVDEGCKELGSAAPAVDFAPALYQSEGFVRACADNVAVAMEGIGARERERTTLLFSAHSVPAGGEDAEIYARQFEQCARSVAQAAGCQRLAIGYQSRGGQPCDSWLEPGLQEVMRRVAADGASGLLAVPIGFVCDHMEVLYDLDIEARAEAVALGLDFHRASAVNDHPAFIEALARMVVEG